MKTFIINLPKDTARLAFMEQQLQSLQIQYEVLPATIGVSLSPEYKASIYDESLALQENGHTLSDTQIACADSHRRIYEKIVKENIPYALILEDDVVLDRRIQSVCTPGFIARSKVDWIQLDYIPFDTEFVQHWIKSSTVMVKRQPLFMLYVLLKIPWLVVWGCYEYLRERIFKNRQPISAIFARPLYLTGAYIITARGARICLSHSTPIRFAADRLQNYSRRHANLKLKGVVPLLAKQNRAMFSSNIVYD